MFKYFHQPKKICLFLKPWWSDILDGCEAALDAQGNANSAAICSAIAHANIDRAKHQVPLFGIPDQTLCDGAKQQAENNADGSLDGHSDSGDRPGQG